MPSKHEIRSSKTPGNETGAVTKNSTSHRPYDSGSDSEYISEYETDSDSDASEESPCQDESAELSLLTSTLEFSSDDLFHKESRKHTQVLMSDLISSFASQHSDISDEYVPPIASVTKSPHVQMMDRNGGPEFLQTPVTSFRSQPCSPTGSTGSGESFFSLQINRNSFTNQLEGLQSFTMKSARSFSFDVDDNKESGLDGTSRMKHPLSQLDDFVLPLTFTGTKGKNMNEKKKKKKEKKKKKKKKKCACFHGFCCKWPSCHCKCPTFSCNCFSWPSCSSKCFSCSGCCTCPSWSSFCQLPCCSCKCPSWPTCSWSCPSIWRFRNCKT